MNNQQSCQMSKDPRPYSLVQQVLISLHRPITILCKFDQAPLNFITKKRQKPTEAGHWTGAGYAQRIGAIATQLITINREDWSHAALQASGGMSYYVAARAAVIQRHRCASYPYSFIDQPAILASLVTRPSRVDRGNAHKSPLCATTRARKRASKQGGARTRADFPWR